MCRTPSSGVVRTQVVRTRHAMHAALRRDPDERVVRAITRERGHQHDAGHDEQDDAADGPSADEEREHNGCRRDDKEPKRTINDSHVLLHDTPFPLSVGRPRGRPNDVTRACRRRSSHAEPPSGARTRPCRSRPSLSARRGSAPAAGARARGARPCRRTGTNASHASRGSSSAPSSPRTRIWSPPTTSRNPRCRYCSATSSPPPVPTASPWWRFCPTGRRGGGERYAFGSHTNTPRSSREKSQWPTKVASSFRRAR